VRILHLSQRYFPVVGGAEIHLAKISEYLVAAGHQVDVVTSDAFNFELFWDSTARRVLGGPEEHNGVNIRRFPVKHMPFSPTSYWVLRRLMLESSKVGLIPVTWIRALTRFTPRMPELSHWIGHANRSYDLVMGMNIAYERFLADGLSLARRSGLPFVCIPLTHLGAGAEPATDRLGQYYTMRHQVALVTASDGIVAQTTAEKLYFEERGMDPGKIIVGGPGVTPAEVTGGNAESFRNQYGVDGPFVLSVGVMSKDKGTIHLVQAMQMLWRSGRQEELVLVGHPLPEFQEFYFNLPSDDRQHIHFLGMVGDQEKKNALAAASLFALPSRADSFGIVYLEAWLYGLPVVGARTWGVSDVIDDGKDGVLVPFADPAALAEALAGVLDNPAMATVMGERGSKKVLQEHTWEIKCRKVLELYETLVARNAR